MDVAIPCGLIINELISNSFKYAFKGKTKGTIFIYFKPDLLTNTYELRVGDDGVGIPDHVDIMKTKSLGMKIIHKLVQQIDGEMQNDFSNGTEFIITFKIS